MTSALREQSTVVHIPDLERVRGDGRDGDGSTDELAASVAETYSEIRRSLAELEPWVASVVEGRELVTDAEVEALEETDRLLYAVLVKLRRLERRIGR
jgi:hypothetical protein